MPGGDVIPTPSVAANSQEIAVMKVQMGFIQEALKRIEGNHLIHINDELRRINDKVDLRFETLNASVTALKLQDATTKPSNDLFWEIIKYVVIGVVGGGLLLLSRGTV